MNLICRVFGHKWKTIYTDDDQCQVCKMIRYWPIATGQEHLWTGKNRNGGLN